MIGQNKHFLPVKTEQVCSGEAPWLSSKQLHTFGTPILCFGSREPFCLLFHYCLFFSLCLYCLTMNCNNTLFLSPDAYAWTSRIFLLTSIPDAEDFGPTALSTTCSASTQQPPRPGTLLQHQLHWGPAARTLFSLPHQSNPRGASPAVSETDSGAEFPQLIFCAPLQICQVSASCGSKTQKGNQQKQKREPRKNLAAAREEHEGDLGKHSKNWHATLTFFFFLLLAS